MFELGRKYSFIWSIQAELVQCHHPSDLQSQHMSAALMQRNDE